jgi:transposase-like protein
MLVSQDRECAQGAAPQRASGSEKSARGDLERRGQKTCPRCREQVHGSLRGQVPKAVAKITDDLDELLAFYDYPAEHWVHLRTTNPIESTFATVRHRSKITKGPGSRAAGLAMAFKLIEAAQARWRAVNAPHLVALVRAGAVFQDGKLIERPDEQPQPEAA